MDQIQVAQTWTRAWMERYSDQLLVAVIPLILLLIVYLVNQSRRHRNDLKGKPLEDRIVKVMLDRYNDVPKMRPQLVFAAVHDCESTRYFDNDYRNYLFDRAISHLVADGRIYRTTEGFLALSSVPGSKVTLEKKKK